MTTIYIIMVHDYEQNLTWVNQVLDNKEEAQNEVIAYNERRIEERGDRIAWMDERIIMKYGFQYTEKTKNWSKLEAE